MPRLLLVVLVLVVVIAIAVTLLLTRGNGNVSLAVNDRAVVTCSEECAARGQCGTLNNSRPVVLASTVGPEIRNHNSLYLNNTQVVIMGLTERQLIAARNGNPLFGQAEPFNHTFFQVSDQEKTAWVSGWCLARPE